MNGQDRFSPADELMLRAMGIRLEAEAPPRPCQARPIERNGEAELYWKIASSMIRELNDERAKRNELENALLRTNRIIRGWMAVALCAGAGLVAALALCWLQRVAGGR